MEERHQSHEVHVSKFERLRAGYRRSDFLVRDDADRLIREAEATSMLR